MQRSRTGRDRDGMFRADEDREIFFEGIEIRTHRRDPIGLEGFEDVFDFGTPYVWWRKVYSVFIHKWVKSSGDGRMPERHFRSQVSAVGSQVRVLQVQVRVRGTILG